VIVGFTGTREGMSGYQEGKVAELINDLGTTEFHHGDCVGADAEAYGIASDDWGIRLVCHPPLDDKLRAWTYNDETREPKPYLERDRDIVDECELLIATPKQNAVPELFRGSGTWYTIRYANEVNRHIIIVWPQGATEIWNAPPT